MGTESASFPGCDSLTSLITGRPVTALQSQTPSASDLPSRSGLWFYSSFTQNSYFILWKVSYEAERQSGQL